MLARFATIARLATQRGRVKRLMLFAVLALACAWISPTQAEIDYPYCIKVYTRDGYIDCSFSTLAQCQATASGRPAQCYLDPFYKGAPGSARYVNRPRLAPYLSGPSGPYYVPHKRHYKLEHRRSRHQRRN